MRTLITDAIVVNDPQVKVSTKGKEYVEFRCVNHDNDEDFWFSCVGFHPQLINFIKAYFKKGSRIYVNGELKEKTYKSKDGEPGIDRSMVLNYASFVRDGSKQNDSHNEQKGDKQSDMDSMTSESNDKPNKQKNGSKNNGGAKPEPEPKPAAPVEVNNDAVDDLPF